MRVLQRDVLLYEPELPEVKLGVGASIYCNVDMYNLLTNHPEGVTIESLGKPTLLVKVVGSSDPDFFEQKTK